MHRGSKPRLIAAALLAVCALIYGRPAAGGPSLIIFYVDDPADLSDRLLGDRLCQTTERRCTLRAAIEEANAQPLGTAPIQIQLIPGAVHRLTHADAATLESDIGPTALPIRTSVLIVGSGGTIERDDAAEPFRIFSVDPEASLDLANLTIAEGLTTDTEAGGGIHNRGAVIVSASVLRENQAGDAGGGGLFNSGTATLIATEVAENTEFGRDFHGFGGGGIFNRGMLELVNCSVRDNVVGGGDFSGDGGGLHNAGETTIRDSTFRGNRTGAFSIAGHGAAIFSDGDLSISHSAFLDNGTGNGGDGGALFNAGAAEIVESEVRGNRTAAPLEDLTVGRGGGIANVGELAVIRSTIAANSTGDRDAVFPGSGGDGGGIFNLGGLRLHDSTVEGNSTGSGGARSTDHGGHGAGIFNSGNATLVNATIGGNRAGTGGSECDSDDLTASAGGSGGGLYNAGTLMLLNVTIAENFAGAGGECSEDGASAGMDGRGGGILAEEESAAHVEMRNALVANNFAVEVGGDCYGSLAGSFNLVAAQVGCMLDAGNIVGEEGLLSPLADNGGPTLTYALLDGSPAIDAGDPSGCRDADDQPLLADQRGAPRPAAGDGRCDIGAFELGATPTPRATSTPSPVAPTPTATAQPTSSGSQIGGGCALAPDASPASTAWLLLFGVVLVRSLIRK